MSAGADEAEDLVIVHPLGGFPTRTEYPSDDHRLALRGFVFLLILADGFSGFCFLGRLWLSTGCGFFGGHECSASEEDICYLALHGGT